MIRSDRRLQEVRFRIAAACARAHRDPASVSLVVVTKTVPAERVRELVEAGHSLFGENRVQEAIEKIATVGAGATWHLVGHLQRNKARAAIGRFDLIHSVDGVELARELERRAAAAGVVQKVLVQANLAGEATKHGADEGGVLPLAEAVVACSSLDLRGLMVIPPPVTRPEDARPWFRRLAELREAVAGRLRRPLPELSMGMTDDFEVAIEEGATLVRIGRAIVGERA